LAKGALRTKMISLEPYITFERNDKAMGRVCT